MANSVIQKAIALILLIVAGYLLKRKFQDSTSTGAIRNFILNVALPATIFLSTIEIDTQLDLILLPSFALAVNLFLMAIGLLLAYLLMQKQGEPAKTRALILLFPSLAPGLTVYPFIEQFLGRQGLAWVALADMGNKVFVLIGLYALAIYWFHQSSRHASEETVSGQWGSIGRFLLTEPVNIAIVVGFVLASFKVNAASLPIAVVDVVQKLAVCATPMILFYVGITLNFKSFQFGTIFTALLAKAGAGFLFSAAAIVLLKPTTSEAISLFVALPQASFSLWPLLHATRINQQKSDAERGTKKSADFFDIEFATALLAMSFPFSILVLLVVFSSGTYFNAPDHLLIAGSLLLGVFGVLLIAQTLPVRLQNPVQVQVTLRSPLSPKPEDLAPLPAMPELPVQMPLPETIPLSPALRSSTELERLSQLIRRYLHTEIHDRPVNLRLQYILKERVFLVVGQHNPGVTIDLDSTLEYLEKDVRLFEIGFLDQIRLYFRMDGDKKPYTCYSIPLKPAAVRKPYAVKA